MTTYDEIKQEIKQELAHSTIDELRERNYEYIDNYVPIYNSDIIKEWQDMPGEYDDRGGAEFGTDGSISIVGLMSLDLTLYYGELLERVLSDIEEELESVA
jgi:hypothetical protein